MYSSYGAFVHEFFRCDVRCEKAPATAPRALLPEEGLVPGEDDEVMYSGGHGWSILDRMANRGEVEKGDLRVLCESAAFPTTSFGTPTISIRSSRKTSRKHS